MKRCGLAMAGVLLAAAGIAAPSTASAITAAGSGGSYTYTFTGTCGDCQTAVATLTVSNYTPDGPLNNGNLVDFTYTSNLTQFSINPSMDAVFSVVSPFLVFDQLSGSIDSSSGHYDISVQQHVIERPGSIAFGAPSFVTDFESSSTSPYTWTVSSGPEETHLTNLDYGTGGTWNGTVAAVSAAPEPGTWALMLGGIGMLGAMIRVANARRREDEVNGIATA